MVLILLSSLNKYRLWVDAAQTGIIQICISSQTARYPAFSSPNRQPIHAFIYSMIFGKIFSSPFPTRRYLAWQVKSTLAMETAAAQKDSQGAGLLPRIGSKIMGKLCRPIGLSRLGGLYEDCIRG
jgi:hypothetical protein